MEKQIILALIVGLISFVVGILVKTVSYSFNKSKIHCSFDNIKIDKIERYCEWLKEVHNKTDQDGVPLWYVPRELLLLIKHTSDNMIESNIHLKEIKNVLKENGELLKKLK